jgi:hypothetical protein
MREKESGVPIGYSTVDPRGRVHQRVGGDLRLTHCVAVRPSYAIALETAKKSLSFYRHRYEFLTAVTAGKFEAMKPNEWYSQEDAAAQDKWLRTQAETHLGGVNSFSRYEVNVLTEEMRRVTTLKAEGYYDRWSIASWHASLHDAEQAGIRLKQMPRYAEVFVLDVQTER